MHAGAEAAAHPPPAAPRQFLNRPPFRGFPQPPLGDAGEREAAAGPAERDQIPHVLDLLSFRVQQRSVSVPGKAGQQGTGVAVQVP